MKSARLANPLLLFAVLALTLGMLTPPPTAAQTLEVVHEPVESGEHERRVRVDVTSDGPRLWGLRRGGYLGVHLIDLTPELRTHFGVEESAGVMVGSVADESAAAEAGILVGDIITAIDGSPMDGRGSLAHAVSSHEEGDVISLEVFRDGAYQVLQATIRERNRPQLWLNSLSEGEGPAMRWRSGDGSFFVLPTPGDEDVEIRSEKIDAVMSTLHERLASPDFSARMLEFQSNTARLEERIKELEERLLELSEQLHELDE